MGLFCSLGDLVNPSSRVTLTSTWLLPTARKKNGFVYPGLEQGTIGVSAAGCSDIVVTS